MPAHCLPAVMISIVFWKLRKCRFCHHLLVSCFRQPPLVAAEMLSLPLAGLAGRLIPWVLLWVICDTSRAKLRRCGNVHLWRYSWTSRQEMVHSNEWSETVQIRYHITSYNIMRMSTYIIYTYYDIWVQAPISWFYTQLVSVSVGEMTR